MSLPSKKFFIFLFLIVFSIGTLEILFRRSETLLFSFAHSHLFKLELLKRRKGDKFVFLGSSRLQDAVDLETYNKSVGGEPKSFDATFRSPILDEYVLSLKKISELINHETVIVLEWSGAVVKVDSVQDMTAEEASNGFETHVNNFFFNNSALVRNRKSIGLKSILKIALLLSDAEQNKDVWLEPRVWKNLFFKKYIQTHSVGIYQTQPVSHKDQIEKPSIPDKHFRNLMSKISSLRNRIVLVYPPVRKEKSEKERDLITRNILSSLLSDRVNFLDYSSSYFPDEFFRDEVHLNLTGKEFFSRVLARDISKLLAEESHK